VKSGKKANIEQVHEQRRGSAEIKDMALRTVIFCLNRVLFSGGLNERTVEESLFGVEE
jgi:hypothetical protein